MSWWKRLLKKVGGGSVESQTAGAASGGCDHGEIHLREGTAEFEWFVARGELEMGRDLKHGACHLANLLSYDPGNPEWVELLDRYLAAADPNPESLIPPGDKAYFSTEAMRAYIWHREGRLLDAVDRLVNVVHAKPDSRYLESWALEWLEAAGAVESLPEQSGLMLFSVVLNRFPEASLSAMPRLREIRRWARLSERFAKVHPGEGPHRMLRAGLLRKAGLFEEAEAVVRAALESAPDWHLATALGLILRQKGATHEAEQAFETALRLDPSDVSARLEAADMFFEREEWTDALKWYENALSKERQQPWAYPSALFCRWMLTEDERHLRELTGLANKENDRARYLCHRLYYSGLPEPSDATANILRQIREQILKNPEGGIGGSVRITVSSIEAPSNLLAFRLEMEALRREVSLEVTVNAIPHRDPRQPVTPVKWSLWRFDGTDPSPALPAPPEEVVRRIEELAREPYDEPANWAAASRVAEEIGPGRVQEVLSVMVHPPPVPEGSGALMWLPRVQLAAAQVAGQVDAGWEGSARREALLSVLLGPQDWATEAAIRVLARLGSENEAYAPNIHEAFEQLEGHRPDSGYCCWEVTLYRSWLELPHLFPKERQDLERKLRETENRNAKE